MTWRLAEQILPELAEKGLDKLFWELEMPLMPVLADMEMTGVVLDADFLAEMSVELAQRLEELTTRNLRRCGLPLQSQLHPATFRRPVRQPGPAHRRAEKDQERPLFHRRGRAGRPARAASHVIERLLEYRQLTKLQSTYVEALPRLINPLTGRIHTSFDQTGAETGRISSNNPNLQNIPVRSELGRLIRKAFVAPPGHYLLAVDYSQVELRILAHLSGDEAMLPNFAQGLDIHAATASQVYGVPIDAVDSEQRAVAKMMNFATSYGVSAFGLASRTTLSMDEARHFMNTYFETYPGVQAATWTRPSPGQRTGLCGNAAGPPSLFPGVADIGSAARRRPRRGRRTRGGQPSHSGQRCRHPQNRPDPAAPPPARAGLRRPHDLAGARRDRAASAGRGTGRCRRRWSWRRWNRPTA